MSQYTPSKKEKFKKICVFYLFCNLKQPSQIILLSLLLKQFQALLTSTQLMFTINDYSNNYNMLIFNA
jgi:hypothetical protein